MTSSDIHFDIDYTELPKHIGIIMDGNGRWALKRGLPRTKGHQEGLTVTKEIIRILAEMGISYVTLYTFSTENWKRPEKEVNFLLNLISKYLLQEMEFYKTYNIRVNHIGDLQSLPSPARKSILETMERTRNFNKLTVNLAINYGSRDEIVRAFQKIVSTVPDIKKINKEMVDEYLDTAGIPNPDILIRSSGEKRLSNFLLWQSAYSELVFFDTLWPDWTKETIYRCIAEYQKRRRTYGGI